MDKLECSIEHAAQYRDWIANRGGLLVWQSINLSNPGASWTTPAITDGAPTGKPTWQADNTPARHIQSEDEVVVVQPREVKRFRVGVRRGDQGLAFKVTDGGSRRIRREVAKAGEGAWHEFDYSTQEAVILVADNPVPLSRWGGDNDAVVV